ncbi:MAG: thioredoxin-disulfide reductase [Eubacterium sp.]|nr:thioredoxin-disulfide reductase [Eubacterium sp.]
MAEEKKQVTTDIVIIGGGIAGLTAGIYAVRAGKQAMILEAKAYGGQIVNTPDIENYPGFAHISGYDFATGLYQQAIDLGVKFRYERALGIRSEGDERIVETRKREYHCKAVILATGAKNRTLGIDREEELTGRGVSYCATCDGAFFKGKDVAVNGGGNTALEDAAYLSDICNKVYLIHRRDQFRGDAADVEKLESRPNVEFVLNSNVTKLIGEDQLTAVEVTDKVTGAVRELPVSGLFVAIGQEPDNQAFADEVELAPGGYIEAGEDCRTKTPGIFTAGDCRTKAVRQLTTAAADGAVAALAACKYIGS